MKYRDFYRFIAAGLQNLAVIALGLGLFELRVYPLSIGLLLFLLSAYIFWRTREYS